MRCRPLEEMERGGNLWIEELRHYDDKYDILGKLESKGYVEANGNSHSGNGKGLRGYDFSNKIYRLLVNTIGSKYVWYNQRKMRIGVESEGLELLKNMLKES